MRMIGNLVITLENEKGEDIEFRTKNDEAQKNLRHWKEPKETKHLKQFPVSLETTITTSESIITAGVTQQEALMLIKECTNQK